MYVCRKEAMVATHAMKAKGIDFLAWIAPRGRIEISGLRSWDWIMGITS